MKVNKVDVSTCVNITVQRLCVICYCIYIIHKASVCLQFACSLSQLTLIYNYKKVIQAVIHTFDICIHLTSICKYVKLNQYTLLDNQNENSMQLDQIIIMVSLTLAQQKVIAFREKGRNFKQASMRCLFLIMSLPIGWMDGLMKVFSSAIKQNKKWHHLIHDIFE